jgi:hypothetical protein
MSCDELMIDRILLTVFFQVEINVNKEAMCLGPDTDSIKNSTGTVRLN